MRTYLMVRVGDGVGVRVGVGVRDGVRVGVKVLLTYYVLTTHLHPMRDGEQ